MVVCKMAIRFLVSHRAAYRVSGCTCRACAPLFVFVTTECISLADSFSIEPATSFMTIIFRQWRTIEVSGADCKSFRSLLQYSTVVCCTTRFVLSKCN